MPTTSTMPGRSSARRIQRSGRSCSGPCRTPPSGKAARLTRLSTWACFPATRMPAAAAINNHGVIVGSSGRTDLETYESFYRSFIYENGVMTAASRAQLGELRERHQRSRRCGRHDESRRRLVELPCVHLLRRRRDEPEQPHSRRLRLSPSLRKWNQQRRPDRGCGLRLAGLLPRVSADAARAGHARRQHRRRVGDRRSYGDARPPTSRSRSPLPPARQSRLPTARPTEAPRREATISPPRGP